MRRSLRRAAADTNARADAAEARVRELESAVAHLSGSQRHTRANRGGRASCKRQRRRAPSTTRACVSHRDEGDPSRGRTRGRTRDPCGVDRVRGVDEPRARLPLGAKLCARDRARPATSTPAASAAPALAAASAVGEDARARAKKSERARVSWSRGARADRRRSRPSLPGRDNRSRLVRRGRSARRIPREFASHRGRI